MNSYPTQTAESTKTKCYLCGCIEHKQRPGKVRDNQELKILECTSCGLVFLSSFAHIKNNFYESSGMHDQKQLNIETWRKEAENDDERRFQYLKGNLYNKKLLDFGCGAGGFILKARALTLKNHGVEPEQGLKDYFTQHNLIVYQSLNEIEVKIKEGYDIITLFHVLEHLPDPKNILSKLKKLLTEGGQIIIEVPNSEDALLTFYKSESFSKFTYWSCHLYLFNAKTLELLASQVGLKINYIRQIQRYPISNHLYWLSKNRPGGHQHWHFIDNPEINSAYEKQLAAIGKCDTIIASFS